MMSNLEGERTMAELNQDKSSDRSVDARLAQELLDELLDARGHVEMTAKLIPAVVFLLESYTSGKG